MQFNEESNLCNMSAWQRIIEFDTFVLTERNAGSFTFYYSIAHCVGDGRKRKKDR